ncbi:BON domain-containing protein [Anaerophilus nitritogenes]|uniref:BON domain-containing protein n=1 Tax=Anaerophilus nitritogenes TaxID=2498136 RepID=UPI00101CE33E|nr:BON domain-containing protein [Anaerophilus nitritogenes]
MSKKIYKHIPNEKMPSKDDLLTDTIKDLLEEKMQASAMDINVFCRDGHVNLSGMVDVLAEKKMAENIVKKIQGPTKIENKITVAMDHNFTDKHMEKEVIQKLLGVSHLSSVGVKIENGVANLLGYVHTLKDAHNALDVAASVRGIKDVVNNISIDSYNKYDDSTVNSYVTQALSTTNLSYKDIAHSVENGKLTLSGYVNNKNEMEIAKEISMGVEGVTKVINKLKVR